MKVLVQRVARAAVTVEGVEVARIGRGLLLLVGVEAGDPESSSGRAAEKVAGLRVFPDEAGRMNRDVGSIGGAVLVVSQFTLAGSIERGRRPSFDGAEQPERARCMVDALAAALRASGLPVQQGVFGADMAVELVNDGPVTFMLSMPPAGIGSPQPDPRGALK